MTDKCAICSTEENLIDVFGVTVCKTCDSKSEEVETTVDNIVVEGSKTPSNLSTVPDEAQQIKTEKILSPHSSQKVFILGNPKAVLSRLRHKESEIKYVEGQIAKKSRVVENLEITLTRKKKQIKSRLAHLETCRNTVDALKFIEDFKFSPSNGVEEIGMSNDGSIRTKIKDEWFGDSQKYPFANVIEVKSQKVIKQHLENKK